ncbi:hypothetical protein BZG36_02361 [Bifiguratus adelaidae]|uniref:Anhydro-N-acetylmuramic acid kinase n=1 Tax=Bifiguratus adelaidae TaxID=1938954 RepID=A0A261Y151_9FUNG|nr:hypothetical protein BZG36_02361 [Bifiguratus adelaidae]
MRVLGLNSGTSLDGIDLALCDFWSEEDILNVRLIAHGEKQLPDAIRRQVLDIIHANRASLDALTELNFQLGEAFGQACLAFCEEKGIRMDEEVDVISCHGQTIWHLVEPHRTRSTWQTTESAVIAHLTGKTVVSDMRVADVAAGGFGAPLVSFLDAMMFCDPIKTRALQNIGGIEAATSFDTGPGNVLIDHAVRHFTNGQMHYDKDGQMGAQGKVDQTLVDALMSHPYFSQSPPKTTGRELFGDVYCEHFIQEAQAKGLSPSDVIATLTAFTAQSIGQAYRDFGPALDECYIGGGGGYNPTLMKLLQEQLPNTRVVLMEETGIPASAKEGLLFALIGHECIHGRPSNLPNCTGAKERKVLGKITPSNNYLAVMRRALDGQTERGVVDNEVYYMLYSTANLSRLSKDVLEYTLQWTQGYIWQKDPFRLVVGRDEQGLACLKGTTRFDDCLDDEWFIVFLLLKISDHFPDVVIRVNDNDGEFLLIEAAMELPSWLDPDTSDNRVYLYQSNIHIIPLPKTPFEIMTIPPGKLRTRDAVRIVRDESIATVAAPNIQRAAFQRPMKYPAALQDHHHKAFATVPIPVAYLLQQDPSLIAPAIEAFYTRDALTMQASTRMSKFPPSPSTTALITFTKPLYAQLVSQKFYPPKLFTLPPRSTGTLYKRAELGMKVDYDIERDDRWHRFKSALTRNQYFRDELPGSALYKELEAQAKEQYLQTWRQRSEEDEEDQPVPFHKRIDALLADFDPSTFKPTSNDKEDDDAWLNIRPEDLEALLKQHAPTASARENLQGSGEMDLENMMRQFESFLSGGAGLKGAEFIGEGSDDEDEEVDDDEENEEDEAPVQFDVAEFMRLLHPHASTADEVEENEEEALDAEVRSYPNLLATYRPSVSKIRELDEDEHELNEDDTVDDQVSINLATVENLLESFKSQQGLPGPLSGILGGLGVVLPRDEGKENEEEAS